MYETIISAEAGSCAPIDQGQMNPKIPCGVVSSILGVKWRGDKLEKLHHSYDIV